MGRRGFSGGGSSGGGGGGAPSGSAGGELSGTYPNPAYVEFSVFTFRPGGLVSHGVYTTWATFVAAAFAAKGAKTLVIDPTGASGDGQCHIPSSGMPVGGWDVGPFATWVGEPGQNFVGKGLVNDSGAKLARAVSVARFLYLENKSATAIFTGALDADILADWQQCTMVPTSGPIHAALGSGNNYPTLYEGSALITSGAPALTVVDGTNNPTVSNNSFVGDNTLLVSGAGNNSIYADPSANVSSIQSPTAAIVLSGRSSQILYDAGVHFESDVSTPGIFQKPQPGGSGLSGLPMSFLAQFGDDGTVGGTWTAKSGSGGAGGSSGNVQIGSEDADNTSGDATLFAGIASTIAGSANIRGGNIAGGGGNGGAANAIGGSGTNSGGPFVGRGGDGGSVAGGTSSLIGGGYTATGALGASVIVEGNQAGGGAGVTVTTTAGDANGNFIVFSVGEANLYDGFGNSVTLQGAALGIHGGDGVNVSAQNNIDNTANGTFSVNTGGSVSVNAGDNFLSTVTNTYEVDAGGFNLNTLSGGVGLAMNPDGATIVGAGAGVRLASALANTQFIVGADNGIGPYDIIAAAGDAAAGGDPGGTFLGRGGADTGGGSPASWVFAGATGGGDGGYISTLAGDTVNGIAGTWLGAGGNGSGTGSLGGAGEVRGGDGYDGAGSATLRGGSVISGGGANGGDALVIGGQATDPGARSGGLTIVLGTTSSGAGAPGRITINNAVTASTASNTIGGSTLPTLVNHFLVLYEGSTPYKVPLYAF